MRPEPCARTGPLLAIIIIWLKGQQNSCFIFKEELGVLEHLISRFSWTALKECKLFLEVLRRGPTRWACLEFSTAIRKIPLDSNLITN